HQQIPGCAAVYGFFDDSVTAQPITHIGGWKIKHHNVAGSLLGKSPNIHFCMAHIDHFPTGSAIRRCKQSWPVSAESLKVGNKNCVSSNIPRYLLPTFAIGCPEHVRSGLSP